MTIAADLFDLRCRSRSRRIVGVLGTSSAPNKGRSVKPATVNPRPLPRVQDLELLQSYYSYYKVNKGVDRCGRSDNVPVRPSPGPPSAFDGAFVVPVPWPTADVNLKIEVTSLAAVIIALIS